MNHTRDVDDRRVTIVDVARASGFSVGTVSFVVNGNRRVSATTRQRVQAVIDELGYVPNAGARDMRGGGRASRTVALSFDIADAEWAWSICRTIVSTAHRLDCEVLLIVESSVDDRLDALFAAGAIGGAIRVGTRPDEIHARGEAGRRIVDAMDRPCVTART